MLGCRWIFNRASLQTGSSTMSPEAGGHLAVCYGQSPFWKAVDHQSKRAFFRSHVRVSEGSRMFFFCGVLFSVAHLKLRCVRLGRGPPCMGSWGCFQWCLGLGTHGTRLRLQVCNAAKSKLGKVVGDTRGCHRGATGVHPGTVGMMSCRTPIIPIQMPPKCFNMIWLPSGKLT